jgi:ubiquinone/menaquinone biosynthesis C-methylase UbiE
MNKKLCVTQNSAIYEPEIYDAFNYFTNDFGYYYKLCRKIAGVSKQVKGNACEGGKVLELCCGSGRLTIPLAEKGINITGLDIEPRMLAAAKAKDSNIKFIKGDIRTFQINGKFDLIFIPFNSLQNIYSVKDVQKIFAQVKKHLNPNGVFAFDVFNPSIHYMIKYEKLAKAKYKFKTPTYGNIAIDEICKYDSATQTNRVKWTFRFLNYKRKSETKNLDMRCYFPLEIEALLSLGGFKIIKKFGDFKNGNFTSESMKQIFVCKKF